ncbi:MAG: hypothetical protein ACRBBQ_17755 [Cognatishimia sp.]
MDQLPIFKLLIHFVAGSALMISGHHDEPGDGERYSFFRAILNHLLAIAFLFASWYFWSYPVLPYLTGIAAIFSCFLPVVFKDDHDRPNLPEPSATEELLSDASEDVEHKRTVSRRSPLETVAIWVTLISGTITIGYFVRDMTLMFSGG